MFYGILSVLCDDVRSQYYRIGTVKMY